MIGRIDIEAAWTRIAPRVRRTPVIELAGGTFERLSSPLTLKLECLQVTASFKPRGAFNRMLSAAVPPAGVIAASGGNHGIAVAHAAKTLGHRAEIFVPEVISAAKIARLKELGAAVNIIGKVYGDALAASQKRAAETGALVLHAYDQPEILAGQGTVAREFEQQAPGLDTVLVAVGGGGLIGGMAAWYRGRTKLIGVEPRTSCALWAALEAGEPVDAEVSGVAADSLGARRVGELMLPLAKEFVERVVLVEDAAITAAQKALWRAIRIVAEPGGAAALAAVLSGAYKPAANERLGVLVCGANCDPGSVA
ncbi:MAG TPA: threonine/serine dehydratase [Alphaproteobacteria bacterium]|jgi:threonine dehydratase